MTLKGNTLLRLALFILILTAMGCSSGGGARQPVPTAQVFVTQIVTRVPRSTPTPTSPPLPTLPTTAVAEGVSVTPAPSQTPLAEGDALTFDSLTSKYAAKRITFVARVTPRTQKITGIQLRYTFPQSNTGGEVKAAVPVQTIGEPLRQPIQYTMGVDKMPTHEDRVLYRWRLTLADGSVVESAEQTFKVTEAVTAERRDDLPLMVAEQSFESDFPTEAIFRVSLTPDVPIQDARFYLTQNNGILQYDYRVRVATKKVGEPLDLEFRWNRQMGLQIPWQQFASWWVFTDRNGRQWRTDIAYNEYTDAKFHQWTRTATKRAVLFTYDQSAANIAALAKATDDSFAILEKAFGYRLLYEPRIVVYNRQRDFDDWSPPEFSDEFIGLASGQWGGAVVMIYDSIAFTGQSIIRHELTHLFQYQSVREHAPKFWMEGSARFFEGIPESDPETLVRSFMIAYDPPDLAFGVPPLPPDGSGYPYPYYVGATFINWLKLTYGDEAFIRVHTALARDHDFPKALEIATGKNLKTLSKEWGGWIKK